MLDFGDIPRNTFADVQKFNRISTADSTEWMTWLKPRGASMLHILCIGGGGGGGGGSTAAAGAVRCGGGGGGGSGITRLLIPAYCVPDVLYVAVGSGGAAGTASGATGGAGGTGIRSYVSVRNSTSADDVIAVSSNAAAAGGGGGSTTAATGGAAATIATTSQARMALYSIPIFVAGIIGGASGANTGANGVAVTWSGLQCIGGGGGGSTPAGNGNFTGGAVTGAGMMPTLPGGTSGSGLPGDSGIFILKPFLFSPGAGGGTNGAAGTAGRGGDGSYGSGGGGGGGGVTGGFGGRGGDGIVIITSW